MKTFFSDLLFEMYFKSPVERKALFRAGDLFQERMRAYEPLRTPEEISQLASQEAERFYQSGHVWLFINTRHVGTRQQIISTYTTAFIEIYTSMTEKNRDTYNSIQRPL